VQEAGRAGRNEAIQAKCYVLYHEHDLSQHFQLLQRTKLNHKEVQQVWRAIKGLTKFRDRISRSAKELAEAAGWNQEVKDLQNRVAAALAALEDRGYIRRTLNSPQVFATGLLVKDLDTALDLVRSSRSITDRQKEDCARVLQRIIKPDRTGQDIAKVDEIAELLGLKLSRVIDTIQHLRNLKVLNDDQDLSAFVDIRPRAGSRKRYDRVASTEKALLEVLTEQEQEVSMRALNQAAMDHGAPDSHPEDVRRLVNYLKRRKVLTTRRVSKANDVYRMALTSEPASVRKDMEVRHELALACLDNLLDKVPKEAARQSDERKQEQRVQFSLLSLKQDQAGGMFGGDHTLKEIEEALLYLHHVKVIDLQDGFMVIYQRLNVERTEQNTRKQYTQEDYGHLRHHYQNKVEQIHTVGEYARRRLRELKDALAFVDDYFKLAHGDFIRRYFPKRETEITRPLTNARFKELFGELDATQTRVVNDASDHILVAAGPGSGKTRVLVHKVASLLLLEDVKPEQFLMLTFSRAAALELRERIQRMVPEYRGLLRVTTFHGLCFELLGQLGDLDKSETVIGRTMEAIRNNEVDVTSIANKSVFVFDEFQDVDAEQWQFIQLLAETAEKPRIIAVGDDDQNIYAFRGASPEFMAAFRGTFKANTHSLLTNYRSRATLVDLTNHLAGTIRNRIKAGEVLEAHDKRAGVQRIVEHRGGYHLQALVNAVAKARLEGTTAVLTRTNDEAIMATAMLNVAGLKARYVGGSDDF
ncbi:MAG TPA: UvrD-helicase domain-containing protein, partial [Flavobacteriales bacterium]|nr:UvrD-helicase domain-containing protein [Flavobacteriales bacterium]